eukprot:CAMPEP_0179288106 /NCGR_PEP_ID=MMETSP0797-20121207/40613_1 /TAXON_ID=47934 /ORGANISM="Dinophysis acuminata, Strain DAEP01" /LENGTH=114 /DNA_ID=CAMNT_0020997065 /DNA_START=180 /DNA_END=522 /DNA_ORIENTATION=+
MTAAAHENALADGRGEDIDADLIAGVVDGMQLRDRVRVLPGLGRGDPHLVVAHRVEDAAELRPQGGEAARDGGPRVRQVPRDDQHVVLEGAVVDGVHPVLVVPVVEVDVRNRED